MVLLLRVVWLCLFVGCYQQVYAEDLDALLNNLAQGSASTATPVPAPDTPVPVTLNAPAPVSSSPVAVTSNTTATSVSVPTPVPVPTVTPDTPPSIPVPSIAPAVAPVTSVVPVPAVPVTPVMPTTVVNPTVQPVVTPGVVPVPAPSPLIASPVPQVAKVGVQNIKMEISDVHQVSAEGLSTLNVDGSGNWLEKRIWYDKAEQLFEVIRTVVQKASDVRMKFVNEVNQIGQQIDEFYGSMGFQRGEIEELMQAVTTELATEKKIRGGDLSSEERAIRVKIQGQQEQFQALSSDFKLIEDLDDQIDKTMMKAFKEIDACRGLENKAWNNFKDIGMELDDKKARVLYYEMENFHKNIEQKMQYLQNNLFQYLQQQLVTKVTQTIGQITSRVQTMKTQGFDLQSMIRKDAQGDFMLLQERVDAKAKEKIVAEKKAAQEKAFSNTWYGNILNMVWQYLCPVMCKIQTWLMMAWCCVQTVLCKIQEVVMMIVCTVRSWFV